MFPFHKVQIQQVVANGSCYQKVRSKHMKGKTFHVAAAPKTRNRATAKTLILCVSYTLRDGGKCLGRSSKDVWKLSIAKHCIAVKCEKHQKETFTFPISYGRACSEFFMSDLK
jgi:hypothetical protein